MRIWIFDVDEYALINPKASYGLPNNVGSVIQITEKLEHGSYDYKVRLSDGTYTNVREEELDKINSYIKGVPMEALNYTKQFNMTIDESLRKIQARKEQEENFYVTKLINKENEK